jgi:predicted nucleic acid-binding protein
MAGTFLDTNILLYAVGIHPDEERKQRIAEDVIAPMDWHTSAQVIQEFFVNATRRGALPVDAALAFMDIWRRRPVQDVTLGLIDTAVAIHRRYQLSYWDSAIVAGAEAQGCDRLYSEDMSHGQIVGGVKIVNPFR